MTAPAVRYFPQNPPDLIKGNSANRPIWCMENVCLTLEYDPAWKGVLAFDEFSVLNLVLLPIPGTSARRSTFNARELQDTDVTAAMRWFNRNGFPDATKNVMQDAMQAVARQTVISPVRHYLEELQWDGTHRIDEWLQTYCEAPVDGLVRRFGRKWLIAAVARALRPGCKADHALVLEGAQGVGKSSALKALAGEAWFFDGLRDMHGKDASASLKGKWIVELPELSALGRSDVESVKAFLSRTEERYRPPYGRGEIRHDEGDTADSFIRLYVAELRRRSGWHAIVARRQSTELIWGWIQVLSAEGVIPQPGEMVGLADAARGHRHDARFWDLAREKWEEDLGSRLNDYLKTRGLAEDTRHAVLKTMILHERVKGLAWIQAMAKAGDRQGVLRTMTDLRILANGYDLKFEVLAFATDALDHAGSFAPLARAVLDKGSYSLSPTEIEPLEMLDAAAIPELQLERTRLLAAAGRPVRAYVESLLATAGDEREDNSQQTPLPATRSTIG